MINIRTGEKNLCRTLHQFIHIQSDKSLLSCQAQARGNICQSIQSH
jgi:hypothetical protein